MYRFKSLIGAREPLEPPQREVDVILARLAQRHSCREFDASEIDASEIGAIIEDGLQAPSSCNHQNWHFVAVTDPVLKKRARAISGGNHHFEFCSVLIYLCFQKGWTHDKFSIVQSVSGACYHMMLSAHLRGYATIWNAGIGDTKAGCRHARHSADFRDPRRALHRPAEADRAGHQGAAPAARRGLVAQHIRAARSCDLSGKAGSRLPVLRNQQCAQSLTRSGVRRSGDGTGLRISAATRFGRSRRSRVSTARAAKAKPPLPRSACCRRSAPASALWT